MEDAKRSIKLSPLIHNRHNETNGKEVMTAMIQTSFILTYYNLYCLTQIAYLNPDTIALESKKRKRLDK